ncbi:hypothetical protein NC651_025484 [Populus alba x Populus x berolinensis]|nr:hypothetical protein NC651_025484 [Populus alba x Populus x berolinensis]
MHTYQSIIEEDFPVRNKGKDKPRNPVKVVKPGKEEKPMNY